MRLPNKGQREVGEWMKRVGQVRGRLLISVSRHRTLGFGWPDMRLLGFDQGPRKKGLMSERDCRSIQSYRDSRVWLGVWHAGSETLLFRPLSVSYGGKVKITGDPCTNCTRRGALAAEEVGKVRENHLLTDDKTEESLDRKVFIERALAGEGSKGGLVATEGRLSAL